MKVNILHQTKKLRLLICLIFLILCQLPSGLAYNNALAKKMQLEEAFLHIGQEYGVFFNYDREIVANISVEYEKGGYNSVQDALKAVFSQIDLHYQIFDNRYVAVYQDTEKGIESMKKMIAHFQGIVDENENKTRPIVKKMQPLTQRSLLEVRSKRLVFSISGNVTDQEGEPLIGVNIQVKGSNKGTATDFEGNFTLEDIDENAVLVLSYVGYETQEVLVAGMSNLNITMISDSQLLDEVVVVGYGVQKKISITGAISSVSSNDIVQSPVSNVASSLAGRVTGFSSVQLGGKPGDDDPKLFIRGIASLSESNSRPLILVDGVEREFNRLDPNEIESISIMKDASSTAVYGVRGANGVILVTTKRGEAGAPKISFTSNYGRQRPTNLMKMVDSYTFATTFNEAQRNDDPNAVVRFSPEVVEKFRTGSDPLLYPNTDWTDYLMKPSSFNLQNNINIRGGDEKVKYFVSLGYRNEDGLWKKIFPYDNNFSYNQYNLRANLDFNVTKTTSVSLTSGNIAGTLKQPYNSQPDNRFFERMYWAQPYSSPGLVDGHESRVGPHIPDQIKTGFDTGGDGKVSRRTNNLSFDLGLRQKLDFITKGLGFRTKVAYNYRMYQEKTQRKRRSWYNLSPLYVYEPDAPEETRNDVAIRRSGNDGIFTYSEGNSLDMNWYMEAALDYNRSFGDHSVTSLIMYNQSKKYYPSPYRDIPSGYVGLVGRVTYNYKFKYFIDFNAGYNGSENFAKGRRFGFFPAVSGGWVVSEENFMKQVPVISHLKLRGSYGLVGNDKIGGSRFLFLPDTYNANDGGYNFGTTVPQNQITAGESTIGNPLVTWEKSRKQNVGVDVRFFNGDLGVSYDQFYEKRSDILITRRTTPAFIPVKLPPSNLGKVTNKGFEIEVEWRKNKRDFGYFISANLSRARNKIVFNDELPQAEPYMERTGRSVGQTFGYVYDGFWSEDDIENVSAFPVSWYTPHAGDMRYKDLNNDGVVNELDQTAIGRPINPEITGGLRLGMNYKNFDWFVLFNAAGQTSRELEGPLRTPYVGNFRNTAQWLIDGRWTPETAETATNPRFSINGLDYNYKTTSDFWMKDASYIRLRNAEIGYSLTNIEQVNISKLRFYVNGYNLLTFSKLKVIDPEAETGVKLLYPLMQMFNFGLNITFK